MYFVYDAGLLYKRLVRNENVMPIRKPQLLLA